METLFTFLAFTVSFLLFWRIYHYQKQNKIFNKLTKEWLSLSQQLNLKTNFNELPKPSLLKQMPKPKMWGKLDASNIKIELHYFNSLTIKIALENPTDIEFSLGRKRSNLFGSIFSKLSKEKKSVFDQNFHLFIHPNYKSSILFSPAIKAEVMEVFGSSMDGILLLERQEKHSLPMTDHILDSRADHLLSYSRDNFRMQDQAEQKQVQKIILLMSKIMSEIEC
ncbi:hypothetical protein [Aureispira anguillae]|uniref:Uncharacterized protein n=1 Tax=Aureispira anguillae TaxID=2864201 RepID=A0A915YGW0_9BACT|nr:hypothetical protein [Aureispira anguillae]BDS12810.1 hypothetical protein AsAng_0035350 [Aureispira anguillae]